MREAAVKSFVHKLYPPDKLYPLVLQECYMYPQTTERMRSCHGGGGSILAPFAAPRQGLVRSATLLPHTRSKSLSCGAACAKTFSPRYPQARPRRRLVRIRRAKDQLLLPRLQRSNLPHRCFQAFPWPWPPPTLLSAHTRQDLRVCLPPPPCGGLDKYGF